MTGIIAFWWGFSASRSSLEGQSLTRLLAVALARGEVTLGSASSAIVDDDDGDKATPAHEKDAKLLAVIRLKALTARKHEFEMLRSQCGKLLIVLDTFVTRHPTSRPIAKAALSLYRLLLSQMASGAPKRVKLPRGAVQRIGDIVVREAAVSLPSVDVDFELLEDAVVTLGALFDVKSGKGNSNEAGASSRAAEKEKHKTIGGRKKNDDSKAEGEESEDEEDEATSSNLTRLAFFTPGDVRSAAEAIVRAWNRLEDARMLSRVHLCAWSALAVTSAGLYAATNSTSLSSSKDDSDDAEDASSSSFGPGSSKRKQNNGFTGEQVEALAALITRTLRDHLQAKQATTSFPNNSASDKSKTSFAGPKSQSQSRAPSLVSAAGNDKLPELCIYLSAILLRADEVAFAKAAIAVGMGGVLRATLDLLADSQAQALFGPASPSSSAAAGANNGQEDGNDHDKNELRRVGVQILIRLNNVAMTAAADGDD